MGVSVKHVKEPRSKWPGWAYLWVGTYPESMCPFLIAVFMLDPASEEASHEYHSLHAQATCLSSVG